MTLEKIRETTTRQRPAPRTINDVVYSLTHLGLEGTTRVGFAVDDTSVVIRFHCRYDEHLDTGSFGSPQGRGGIMSPDLEKELEERAVRAYFKRFGPDAAQPSVQLMGLSSDTSVILRIGGDRTALQRQWHTGPWTNPYGSSGARGVATS